MKKLMILFFLFIFLLLPYRSQAESGFGILDLFSGQTSTPSPSAAPPAMLTPVPSQFQFRNGIRWGMNPDQVRLLENEPMTERTRLNWSVMLTKEKVAVSRFTADLIFIFRDNRLMMISYELQRQDPDADFRYLQGALSYLYGEQKTAEALTIKNLMDAINPNRYRADQLQDVRSWKTMDDTSIYLYFYARDSFAVLYVSPELSSGFYQTDGL